jgi:hypothetical protein
MTAFRASKAGLPTGSNDAPAVVALRKWLTDADRATEAALPEYLYG